MSLKKIARREPRPVAETLPSINFDKAMKVHRGKVTGLSWHRGTICIGTGNLLTLTEGVQLSYTFRPLDGAFLLLAVTETANGVTSKRRRVACPACGAYCSVLFYLVSWQCLRCHKLLYASQKRVPHEDKVRLWDAAKVTAHRCRKSKEHRATFQRKQEEAWAKLKRWGPRPDESLIASDAQPFVTTRYTAGPPD
ncbi:MAG: hypothetical protein PS018_18760 [bacterium]|nr:hypothetical protein [bacterium]